MSLPTQEQLKDLRMNRDLTLEQLAKESRYFLLCIGGSYKNNKCRDIAFIPLSSC